jgi:hypothetical protein
MFQVSPGLEVLATEKNYFQEAQIIMVQLQSQRQRLDWARLSQDSRTGLPFKAQSYVLM